jgi:signal transduction histidine kinase
VNLLGNAVKFTERGWIELAFAPSADGVAFHVRDSGPGIRPEDRDRVFEPFVQLGRSLTSATAGTGLGLPVSRQLARLLGGEISVAGEVGVGSTFTLWLPVPGARD